jgi:hypothetical protein
MIAKTRFDYGGVEYTLEFDEKDEMDTLNKVIVLANPPRYCNICKGSENFKFTSNKDKEGNIYVNAKCKNGACDAKAKLGQYKAGGYFWHKFELYQPTSPTASGKSADDRAKEIAMDDYMA